MSAKEPRPTSEAHFDAIADGYHAEVPAHVREHLIGKWWALVGNHLPARSRVLDIGCGDGTIVEFLLSKEIDCIGVDASSRLIERGLERSKHLDGRLSRGDALALEHDSGSMDAALLVGVLHHMRPRSAQIAAVEEALRVVREDGVVIVRESNLVNPLFRLYWNYVFPLTARIDRFGGENWIPADALRVAFERNAPQIAYFTFIPSFVPRVLMPSATTVERRLERGRLARFAAHYVLILRK